MMYFAGIRIISAKIKLTSERVKAVRGTCRHRPCLRGSTAGAAKQFTNPEYLGQRSMNVKLCSTLR